MSSDDNKLSQAVDDSFILDDIEDMPGFVTPPTGAYIFDLEKGILEKELNDKNFFEIPMTLAEVVEVNEKELSEGESLPKPGDIVTLLFDRSNKFGMGNFKDFVRSIAETSGVKTIGEIREASKGMKMLVVLKRTYNKDKDRYNVNAKKAQVL